MTITIDFTWEIATPTYQFVSQIIVAITFITSQFFMRTTLLCTRFISFSFLFNLLLLSKMYMGARRNFSRGGQNHRHFKKSTRFRRAVQKIDHFSARRRRKRIFLRFSRRFRLKYRVSSASAEGASENFRVFREND